MLKIIILRAFTKNVMCILQDRSRQILHSKVPFFLKKKSQNYEFQIAVQVRTIELPFFFFFVGRTV